MQNLKLLHSVIDNRSIEKGRAITFPSLTFVLYKEWLAMTLKASLEQQKN